MPSNVERFLRAIHAVEAIRRRNGASDWRVFRDIGEDGRFVERFIIRSWGEYVRLRTRLTMADRQIQDRVEGLQRSGVPMRVSRLIATLSAAFLGLVPLVAALGEIDAELVEVVVERVARRDDAERTAVLDDRQVPEAPLVHDPQRLHERLVRVQRLRLRRHDVGEPSCWPDRVRPRSPGTARRAR